MRRPPYQGPCGVVSISPTVALQCSLNRVYFVSKGDGRPEKGEVESLRSSPQLYTSKKEDERREAALPTGVVCSVQHAQARTKSN